MTPPDKLVEVGRWYTLADIAEMGKRVEARDAEIDAKQAELDKKIDDAEEVARNGSKLPYWMAAKIFPSMDRAYAWRD